MRDINYRNVKGTPPRVSKLSELENDLNLMTTQEVRRVMSEMIVVSSVNGATGAVTLNIPAQQVQVDWNASTGITSILNKPTVKRVETYLGTTNASGTFSVTYSTPYTSVPDVQPQLQAGTPSQVVRITNSTVNGFTVNVTNRASVTLLAVEVLLAATTPVVGASVSLLVTAR